MKCRCRKLHGLSLFILMKLLFLPSACVQLPPLNGDVLHANNSEGDSNDEEIRRIFFALDEAEARQDFDQAISLYQSYAEVNGGTLTANRLSSLAFTLVELGRFQEALDTRADAVRMKGDEYHRSSLFRDYLWQSSIQKSLGHYDEAVEVLIPAQELTDNHVEESRVEFQNSIPLHLRTQKITGDSLIPGYLREQTNKLIGISCAKARVHIERGDYVKAIELLDPYVVKGSPHPGFSTLALLGVAKHQAGEDVNGVRYWEIESFPGLDYEDVLYVMPIAWRLRPPDEVDEFFEEVLIEYRTKTSKKQWKTETADALVEKGRYHLLQGEWDLADRAFVEAMAIRSTTGTRTHPSYADALIGKACVFIVKGELEQALELAQNALAVLDAELVDSHARKAGALRAIVELEKRIGSEQNSSAALSRLDGILSRSLGIWEYQYEVLDKFFSGIEKQS